MTEVPMDGLRLDQIEAGAHECPDACAADVLRLVAEVRMLRDALAPFAQHSFGGFNSRSGRRMRPRVTEGQLCSAWLALNDDQGRWRQWSK